MITRIFFFLISSLYLCAQTSVDQTAFKKAMSALTDSARLVEFDKFISEYPSSQLLPNAYAAKFQLYSNVKDDTAAFRAVRKFLSLMDESQIVSALNTVAYECAQRKLFLDSAGMLIDQAISLYKNDEPVLLNTKAFVLYQQDRYVEAETLQQKAVSLLPPHSEYDVRYVPFSIQLGFIQLESKDPVSGIKKIILGNIIIPKQSIPVRNIDSLLEVKKIASMNVQLVRDSLYSVVASEFVKYSPDSLMAKNVLAVSLSRSKVLPERAFNLANEAYMATRQSTIDQRSGAAAVLGLTCFNLQRYEEAEKYLTEAAAFANPNESEVFFSLGDVKEKLGKKKEAFIAYMDGMISSRSSSVYAKLVTLKDELFPSLSLDSMLISRQTAALEFTPEPFHRDRSELKKNQYERIVMAELFTGSECKPCLGADIAFDYLIERFKTSSLAILEYHLHIPQPDPLSNTDAEKRGKYYGINSTPTAIFGGTSVVSSGGNKLAAKSKFLHYSDVIERQLQIPSPVEISVSSTLKKNILTVTANALSISKNSKLKLRIAVVEDEVFYQGANGIERHKFVVRKMLKSANGYPFPKNGKLHVSETLKIRTLAAELGKYYDATNARYKEDGFELKAKLNEIDIKRLAIVAFVQDDATHEILQASVIKVE